MAVTVNTKAYTFDSNLSPDSARHLGPAHTYQVKDVLDLKRTAPKPTATFAGVARASAKFARTVTLTSGPNSGDTAELIFECSASIPVGTSDADIDSIRDDIGDFVIASGDGGDLFKKALIVQ